MKKIFSVMLCLMVLISLLTGCQKSDEPVSEPEQTETQTVEEKTPEATSENTTESISETAQEDPIIGKWLLSYSYNAGDTEQDIEGYKEDFKTHREQGVEIYYEFKTDGICEVTTSVDNSSSEIPYNLETKTMTMPEEAFESNITIVDGLLNISNIEYTMVFERAE